MSYHLTLFINYILAVKRAIKIILYYLPELLADISTFFQLFAVLDFL